MFDIEMLKFSIYAKFLLKMIPKGKIERLGVKAFGNSNDLRFLKTQVFDVQTKELLSVLDLKDIDKFEILCDSKASSKIMLSSEECVIKIEFRPIQGIFKSNP